MVTKLGSSKLDYGQMLRTAVARNCSRGSQMPRAGCSNSTAWWGFTGPILRRFNGLFFWGKPSPETINFPLNMEHTIDFPIQYGTFLLKFSFRPIQTGDWRTYCLTPALDLKKTIRLFDLLHPFSGETSLFLGICRIQFFSPTRVYQSVIEIIVL